MKTRPLAAALIAAILLPAAARAEEEPQKSNPRPPAPAKREKPRPAPEAERRPEKPSTSPEAKPEPGPEARRHPQAPARDAASRKRPWIGVSTYPVDPSLREHLEIPDGFGVAVHEVMPESPAATAGLRRNDILVRFEDQRLISPEHLSLLVRTKAKGDRIALTVVRKGREETVEVLVAEADENVFGPFPPTMQEGRGVPPWSERLRRQQDEMLRRQQDQWRDWMDRSHPRGGGPRGGVPRSGGSRSEPARPGEPSPGQAEGPGPRLRVEPGFPLHVFSTEGVLKIDNEEGELTLTRKGGDHHLVLQDKAGKVVYEGPYDPEMGVGSLPEEARRQLDSMKLGNLEIRLPAPAEAAPEKIRAPERGPGPPRKRPDELL